MEILGLIIFVAVIAFILLRSNGKYTPPQSSMPDPKIFRHFEARESLFVNASERAFFLSLEAALPPHFRLQTKTRLEDIIRVAPNLPNPKLAFQLRGRIKSRHIDFLVIDHAGRPRCAIELDGSSHSSQKATAGDTLKNGLFAATGVPLYRVNVGDDFAKCVQDIVRQL
jgi:very-short-patch-repair endonuclease